MIANPILALQLLIWSAGQYDYNTEKDNEIVTFFNANKYGKYSWVYILMPLFAGLVGALITKVHLTRVKAISNVE